MRVIIVGALILLQACVTQPAITRLDINDWPLSVEEGITYRVVGEIHFDHFDMTISQTPDMERPRKCISLGVRRIARNSNLNGTFKGSITGNFYRHDFDKEKIDKNAIINLFKRRGFWVSNNSCLKYSEFFLGVGGVQKDMN
jgi:hypothetical protein